MIRAMNFKYFFLFLLSALMAQTTSVRAANEVTQIKLQRTQCYGACPADELTLNSDGSAQYSGDRNSAREGFFRGKIAPEQFAALVKALEEQNFFELRPRIGYRMITDVSDTIISATRKSSRLGNTPYTVASRGGAAVIGRLKATFDKASAQIEWTKDEAASKAGVRGTLMRDLTREQKELFADKKPPVTSMRMDYALVELISAGENKIVYATHSDNGGNFQLLAPPGKYLLSIRDVNDAYDVMQSGFLPQWWSDGEWIEIGDGQILPVETQLRDFNKATSTTQ